MFIKNGLHKVARFFYNCFMKDIIVKRASKDILSELNSIKFDSSYISVAVNKYNASAYKVFNLKAHEANILKQLCLSLGFDCAVSKDTVTCKCEYTDAIIFATDSQLLKLKKKLLIQPFRLKQLSTLLNVQKIKYKTPKIMGILNVTPDSFSDGGKYNSVEKAVEHALQLVSDGADIIDIGGESTRPNADSISIEEEINRVVPVIKAIRNKGIDVSISIDTRNYLTAKAAIEAGANIINDVSGLDYDKNLFDYVVTNNIPVVIMHSDKVPADSNDFSSNIVEEVYFSLSTKVNLLLEKGMSKENIIIDVGIGFGKSKDANFELLKRLEEFTSLGVDLLLGISRKSFIRNQFNMSLEDSDIPTAMYSAMLPFVAIHRVHNVKLTKQYLSYASLLHD